MTQSPIAQVRLAPGRAGFYDELSNIYLTVGRPTANVYSGTNCAQLRESIKNGTIQLVSGSLGEHVPAVKIVEDENGKYWVVPNIEELHKPVTIEDIQGATVVEEEPAVEEVIETVEEEKEVAAEPTEAPAEEAAKVEEKAEEEVTEEAAEETEETVEETVEETEEVAAEEKPKKTTRKRATKKTTKETKE